MNFVRKFCDRYLLSNFSIFRILYVGSSFSCFRCSSKSKVEIHDICHGTKLSVESYWHTLHIWAPTRQQMAYLRLWLSIHLAWACRVDLFLLFLRQLAKRTTLQEFPDLKWSKSFTIKYGPYMYKGSQIEYHSTDDDLPNLRVCHCQYRFKLIGMNWLKHTVSHRNCFVAQLKIED